MDIYSYITTEIANYALPIDLQGWKWNMKEHIQKAFFYKYGRLLTGNSDLKPVKNIVKPILDLQYRTEDLDVKDVILWINDPEKDTFSFFVKKYYEEVFLKENNLDDFLDEMNESRVDYGLALLYNNGTPTPEVIPLDNIAFCDQHNILAGPLCFEHNYSPDELKGMERRHWGDSKFGATVTIDELITLSKNQKGDDKSKAVDNVPGKYIKIYELHGNLPSEYLNDNTEDTSYTTQMQVVGYYQNKDGEKQGVTLYRGKSTMDDFKIATRDAIKGRACGWGGVEELSEDQVWVNYSALKFRELLDSAAKTIFKTTSPTVANTEKVKNAKNQEAILLEDGEDISQVDTFPRNINLFENYIQQWEMHAQKMGAANDSIMGETPKAGTPFKLQELITSESHSMHEYRRGKFAKTAEEIWRDWVIPHIVKKIKNGAKFTSFLTFEEMQTMADKVIKNRAYKMYANGEITADEIEPKKEELRAEFMKDNKKFISWTKDEIGNVSLSMKINVVGKQKNLSLHADKLVNVFRQIASAPQLLDDPRMERIFNKILEASGLEPLEFGGIKLPQAGAQMAGAQAGVNTSQTAPIAELSNE